MKAQTYGLGSGGVLLILSFILHLSSLSPTQAATVYYVWTNSPSDGPGANWATAFHEIQDAVNVATNGDTVLVTNGVYATGGRAEANSLLTNRVCLDRGVVLTSVNGPDETFIVGDGPQGSNAVRCVYVSSNAWVSGFTLTNGHTFAGSGFTLDRVGGGARCDPGGIVSNCLIVGNEAGWGGGVCSGEVFNCVIATNRSTYQGGGTWECRVNDSIISNNVAGTDGGGIRAGEVHRCIVRDNTSTSVGGGISWSSHVCNSLIVGNHAGVSGGGQYGSILVNCTVADNSAANAGGGADGGTMTNCVVYYNTDSGGSPNYTNAIFVFSATTPLYVGDGNITDAPMFVDRPGGDYRLLSGSQCIDAGTNASWMSTATDLAGTNRILNGVVDMGCYEGEVLLYALAVTAGPGGTVNGGTVNGDYVDGTVVTGIAATASNDYYFAGWTGDVPPANTNDNPLTLTMDQARTVTADFGVRLAEDVILVDAEATGLNNGATWEHAFTNLRAAMFSANVSDQVWIAEGIYRSGNTNTVNVPGVACYGGFTNGMDFADRDPASFPVVLDGEGTHLVVHVNASGVVLDGLVISNGFGAGSSFAGGLYANGSPSLEVLNCRFVGNRGVNGCGATFTSGPTIVSNCVFEINRPRSAGGRGLGFSVLGGAMTVVDCEFNQNTYGGLHSVRGGAIYFQGSQLTATRCTFLRNHVRGAGGGLYGGGAVYVDGSASAVLVNCAFVKNACVPGAPAQGGALYATTTAGVTVSNCTFSGNYAFGPGGGLYVDEGSVGIYNSIIWTNNALSALDICVTNNASVDIAYTDMAGTGTTRVVVGPSATLTLGDDLLLDDPLYSAGDDDVHLQSATGRWDPTLNGGTGDWTTDAVTSPCIDAGDPASDYDLEPEPNGGNVNMGAYGNTAQASKSYVPPPTVDFVVEGSPSEHGTPTPHDYGTNAVDEGSTITNTVATPADESAGQRWVCLGYEGTGSVPASGTSNTVSFTITNNSTLTWVWTNEYELVVSAAANGSVNSGVVNGWYTNGVTVTNITATPSNGYSFAYWTGDVPPANTNDNPLSLTMDQARAVTGNFALAASPTHYVSLTGGHTWPYTNWAWAATNIQSAVSAAAGGDTVLVTNGVYDTGGAVTPGYSCSNRVVITNDIVVQSVEGPAVTFIEGAQASGGGNGSDAVRGVYMSAGVLSGFTVTNGHTMGSGDDMYDKAGGGVNMYGGAGVVTNCTLAGNSAFYGGGSRGGTLNNCTLTGNSADAGGGGSKGSTLNNCTLTGNSAGTGGGGSQDGTLNNCMLTGNSAGAGGGGSEQGTLNNCTLTGNSSGIDGGGSFASTLNNCIVYFNTAVSSGDNWRDPSPDISYSCTTPDPGGDGNITNDPQFVDAGFGYGTNHVAGDCRLRYDSPCIDVGSNGLVVGSTDLDGNPRILNGTVDMGAYEFDANDWCELVIAGVPGEHDSPAPQDYGTNTYAAGTVITNTVATPADEAAGQRWVCLGYEGTGSVPASGTSNTVSFTITTNSTLTWLWTNEYELVVYGGPGGSVNSGEVDGWYTDGTTVTGITATPLANYDFIAWTGDVPAGNTNDNPLTLTMNAARTVSANFTLSSGLTNTWMGAFSDGWANPLNWSLSITPRAGDHAVVTGHVGSILLANPTEPLASFEISNATLMFTNWATSLNADEVTIHELGVLTHAGPFDVPGMSNRVHIACSNLTIGANGSIDVSSKGYSPTNGPGGGMVSPSYGGGGGYGGQGGRSLAWDDGGATYGSVSGPLAPGSGGSGPTGDVSSAGSGGGAVRIEASGAVTINGSILADGEAGPAGPNGGGSGGSIYITCDTFGGSETGLLSAEGGGAGNGSAGDGGGGRIAVDYQALGGPTKVRYSVAPGGGGWGAADPDSRWHSMAEMGTVYFPDTGLLSETLTDGQFNRVNLHIPGFTSWAVNSLTVSNCSLTFAAEGFDLTVTNDLLIGTNGLLGIHGGSVSCGGNLVVTNAGEFCIYSGPTNGAGHDYGALVGVTGDMVVAAGSWVYPFSDGTNGGSVLFEMSNLTVHAGGGFNANARGYAATNGPGTGGLAAGGASSAGGGGHGGTGGRGKGGLAYGGATYGSVNAPIDPGSGGGCRSVDWPDNGGRGGGAIRIVAQDSVMLHGMLTADGGDALDVYYAGAGAGGAISITCDVFAASGGILSAEGGSFSAPLSSGGGGGGRIALVYNSLSGSPEVGFSTKPGRGWAEAGTEEEGESRWHFAAQPGTVYLPDTNLLSEVLTDDLFSGVSLFVPGFSSWDVSSLSVSDCSLRLGSEDGFELNVAGDLVIGTNGVLEIGADSIASHSTLTCGGNLVLTNGGVLAVYSGVTNGAPGDYGALVSVTGEVHTSEGSWIVPSCHSTNGGGVLFRMQDLVVDDGSGINANGRGYAAETGPGAGSVDNSFNGAGGAGYGGKGGRAKDATGLAGDTYGSTNAPLAAGSGGGWALHYGGRGGGLVRIEAARTVTLHGSLTADGASGIAAGGGGSGGAILVSCSNLVAGAGAELAAGGGDGEPLLSGAGGGGRVAVWVDLTAAAKAKLLAGQDAPEASAATNHPTFQGTLSVDGGTGWTNPPAADGAYPGSRVFLTMSEPELLIESQYGTPDPDVGAYTNVYGTWLTNSVGLFDTHGTTQYMCTGWALSGQGDTNGNTTGSTTDMVMIHTNNAALTWLWDTNYWLDTEAGAGGDVSPADNWYALGTNVDVEATPSNGYAFAGWTGDVPGGNTNDNPLSLSMDQARTVTANFEEAETEPILLIEDGQVTEGDSGTTTIYFGVTLDLASSTNVTVFYATSNGTAEADGDYLGTNGSIMIPAGIQTGTIAVAVVGDVLDEGVSESFFVNVDATNAFVADAQARGTILDDDEPFLSVSDASVTEGHDGTTNMVFDVELSVEGVLEVTVDFLTSPWTATSGNDYTSTNGSISIPAGESNATIVVPILGEHLFEADPERFYVILHTPVNASITDDIGVGSILNDDTPPEISLGAGFVTEGDDGLTNLVFTVNMNTNAGIVVTVDYVTSNDVAMATNDYVSTNGTVQVTTGNTNATFTVPVVGDVLHEGLSEQFYVILSNPSNATIGTAQNTGTIVDDDGAPTVSLSEMTVTEGDEGTTNAEFTVILDAVSGLDATVTYTTSNGAAEAGLDFVDTNNTVTVSAGDTNAQITVIVLGDTLFEGSGEVFYVNLSDPSNAVTAAESWPGTIEDDDAPPGVSITVPNGTETNEYAWLAGAPQEITWTHAGDVSGDVTLYYSLNGGQVWNQISGGTNATADVYKWTTPQVETTNALIWIQHDTKPSVTDTSDAPFHLSRRFKVTTPNGGEHWYLHHTNTIEWGASYSLGSASIDYSPIGDFSGTNYITITNFAPSTDGSWGNAYQWIPAHDETVTPSTNARIRVRTFPGMYADASDEVFTLAGAIVTSPGSGQVVAYGAALDIQWTSFGCGTNVMIELQTEAGGPWTVIIDNTVSVDGLSSRVWTATNGPTEEARLRVTSLSDPQALGVSETFTIAGITIHEPLTDSDPAQTARWRVGTTQAVRWVAAGADDFVNISYSTNSGVSWISEVENYPNVNWPSGSNSYPWPLPLTVSDSARIKIAATIDPDNFFSTSAHDFHLSGVEITAPTLGATWIVGQTNVITWQHVDGTSPYTLQYIKNGTETNFINSGGLDDLQCPWTPPMEAVGTDIVIRLADSSGYVDLSEAFDIESLSLSVTSAYGAPSPDGITTYAYGTNVLCWIEGSPSFTGPTQHVCVGWTGTGSVPATGTDTQLVVTITNDSTLTWVWTNLYELAVGADANGSVNSGTVNGWYTNGVVVTSITATPSNGHYFVKWTGDVPPANTNDNPLALTMNQARVVTANFAVAVTVTNVSPAANAVGVSKTASVLAAFNMPVDTGTVTATTFFLHSGQSIYEVVPDTIDGNTAARIDPAGEFRPGELIFANVTRDVEGTNGVSIRPYAWQFHVATDAGNGLFDTNGPGLGGWPSTHAALGDIDDDGDLDAVVVNRSGLGNRVYTNDGAGLFGLTGQTLGGGNSWGTALGDIDRDGDLDAVIANFGTSKVYRNNGPGTFSDSGQNLDAGASRAVSLGDLDGDGWLDAVFANDFGPNRVYINNGSGTLVASGQGLGDSRSWQVALGDVNGDGTLDAFVANTGGNTVYTNDGSGTLANSGQSLGSSDSRYVELGDLNGDGHLDAFVANATGNRVYTNDGSGLFLDSGQSLGSSPSYGVALGDVDADGDLDAFVANYSQPNRVYINDGTGSFTASGQALGAAKSWAVALGDLNGNGALDAFVANDGQPNMAWFNQVPPAAPSVQAATGVTAYGFDANWLSAAKATNYFIDVATDNAFGAGDLVPGYSNLHVGNVTSRAITGLTPSSTYYYRLRAQGLGGTSTNSGIIAVGTVTAAAIGVDPVGLSFSSVPDNIWLVETFIVTNGGQMAFAYTNEVTYGTGASGWFVADPGYGYLAPGAWQVHTGAVALTALPVGVYHATNTIVSAEATNSPQQVSITLTITNALRRLTVTSPYGDPLPPVGTHHFDDGTNITCLVTNSPVAAGSATQYVCVGWAGTGSVPPDNGTTNTGPFVITNQSDIAWNWKTQYLLNASSGPNGYVAADNGWHDAGSNVTVTAVASNGYHFLEWTGDVPPAEVSNAVIVLTMDRARTLAAGFEQDSADLVIGKAGWGEGVAPGVTNFGYTITVQNFGPNDAVNVFVVDIMGAGLTSDDPLTNWLGTVAASAETSFPFRVSVDPAVEHQITNTATVFSDTTDPVPGNDQDVAVNPVDPTADLSITKVVSGGEATAGEDLVYTITVENLGPSMARNVQVVDTPSPDTTTSDALTNDVGDLPPGTVTSYQFTVTINGGASGTMTNTATVSSDATDPVGDNNEAVVATVIGAAADLSVVKSGPATGIAGSNLVFTISVTNAGPSQAQNVRVTDIPPPGATPLDPTVKGLGDLAPGAATSFTFTVSIHANALGTITNRATVTSDTIDTQTVDNASAWAVTVQTFADLNIAKAVTGGSTNAGEDLVYTITVTNAGPSLARNVRVIDTLPAGTTSADPLTNNIGHLAVGAVTAYQFTVTIDAATVGTITNTAMVTNDVADPYLADNEAIAVTVLDAEADLFFSKSGPLAGIAGSNLVYTMTVSNAGPSAARSVTVIDTLPAGVTEVSPLTNNLGDLAVAVVTSYTFTVFIDEDAMGWITNTAAVSADTYDPVPGNDDDEVATEISAEADLSLTKTVTGGFTIAGSNLVYTIAVSNAGPSLARNVTVTDTIPASVVSPDPLVTNLGHLAAGAVTSYEFTVTTDIDLDAEITNRADTESDATDPQPANNTAWAPSTIEPPVYELVVESAHGNVIPPRGTNAYARNTVVNCRVTTPWVTEGTAKYACIGWSGTGSVPGTGGGTVVNVTVTNELSALAWRWATNYWLQVTAGANGSVQSQQGWLPIGSNVTMSASPKVGYVFDSWSGDVPAESISNNPLMVVMDQARSITGNFASVPPVLYVDHAAAGTADGLTWPNAFTNPRDALAVAIVSQSVWVAEGVYVPGTNRTNSFDLVDGVPVYGGFTNGMQDLLERDWDAYPTVLSGDIGISGVFTDNCYHVVVGASNVWLDGFTIRDGYANGSGEDGKGAGMYNDSAPGNVASPVVSHCTFVSNTATIAGGGLYYWTAGFPYSVEARDCRFVGNRTLAGDGGGLFVDSTGPYGTGGTISNCVFVANEASRWGGGAHCGRFARDVVDCTFVDNVSAVRGGGLYLARHAGGAVAACLFAGNVSDDGGALAVAEDRPTVQHCVFAGNRADEVSGWGGAVYVRRETGLRCEPRFLNCTFDNNRAESGHAMFSEGAGGRRVSSSILNCVVWDDEVGGLIQDGAGATTTGRYSCVKDVFPGENNTTNNPLFIGGAAGTWTSTGVYDALAGTTLLTDTNAAWSPGGLAGLFLNPNTNQALQVVIEDNGSNTLTVLGNVAALAQEGETYRLRDYHVASVESPCVDSGIFVGYPYMGEAPDMGAYEWGFAARVRVFLEGPYDGGETMSTALRQGGHVPLASPYAADARSVSTVPSNATDWVLLQVQETTNGGVIAAQSTFLGHEGYLLSDDGTTGIVAHVHSGSYYLVVKHRNHLSVMSAEPVPFTNEVVEYIFTSGPDRFYGGASGTVEVDTDVWGMAAGDADGDGEVLAVDALVHGSQDGLAGYRRGDLDLSGTVSSQDTNDCWAARQGMVSAVSDRNVVLAPALSVDPPRLTLLAEHGTVLHASGGTGEVHWAIVKNSSGSTTGVDVVTGDEFEYWAGETDGGIDVIEAWDTDNLLTRAYVNVIGTGDVAQAGQAIIIAGRRSRDDPLWPITDYLADGAHDTLLYRGYATNHIRYLSPGWDDGAPGDSDAPSTLANAEQAFTGWAAGSSRLFVYLVDHGGESSGDGYFRLNSTNVLQAADLDDWLDALQDTCSNDVVVVADFCQAGTFVDALTYSGTASRIVIAACASNEPSYFVAGGLVSFSDAFFGGVLLGLDVSNSYEQARGAMEIYQDAQMYDKNGAAGETIVGASFVAGKDIPQIGRVVGNQALSGSGSATLWADDIVSFYPIVRVWCSIIPPDHTPNPTNPVTDLVEIDLPLNPETDRYEASCSGFSVGGAYGIYFYARDEWGSVSLPSKSTVVQSSFDERAILVAGGPDFAPEWNTINNMANTTYHTLRVRLLNNDHIWYLNAHTLQDLDDEPGYDIDEAPSLEYLGNAITNWAATNDTDKLTVYLIGSGVSNTLCVAEDEYLTPQMLDEWLDVFQTGDREVYVVMDFDGSGEFVESLLPPQGNSRINIAATQSGRQACQANDGLVSFTHFFMQQVFNGLSIGESYRGARRSIRRASGSLRQRPMLDDDGDGESTKYDRQFASTRYLGTAFKTGADAPLINSVTPDTVLTNSTALTLWASGVTDVDGITNVWCAITAPDYDGVSDLFTTNLAWVPAASRYEAEYTNFTQNGTYTCTFYARDTVGEVSAAVQCEVLRPDAYEDDDTAAQVTGYVVGDTQVHNMHKKDDADWVRFWAVSNCVYEIETWHWGTNVDTVIDVYRQKLDGTLVQVVEQADDYWIGEDEGEVTWLEYPKPGLYCVRIESGDSNAWGTSTEYDLSIWVPVGEDGVLMVAAIDLVDGWNAPPGTYAVANNETQYFDNAVGPAVYFYDVPEGTSLVTVVAPPGYEPAENPSVPGSVSDPNEANAWGNPRNRQISGGDFSPIGFGFYPMVRVRAQVHDSNTGARVESARLEFRAKSGDVDGISYSNYQNTAWRPRWLTDMDGTFPDDKGDDGVMVPAAACDVVVSNEGYSLLLVSGVILSDVAAGTELDLETLCLAPIDSDGNGIANAWEDEYFPGGMGNATNDPDGDGLDNREEYRCGTDPTNEESCLRFDMPPSNTVDGFTLEWDCVPWRTYRVSGTNDLMGGWPWPWLSPKMEAGNNQYRMQWSDPEPTGNRFYGVDVIVP